MTTFHLGDNHLRCPLEPQPFRIQHHMVPREALPVLSVMHLDVLIAVLIGLVNHLVDFRRIHAESFDGDFPAERFGRDHVDVQRVGPRREDSLRAPPDEHHPPLGGGFGDHALCHPDKLLFFRLDGRRRATGADEHLRRRHRQGARQPLEQSRRTLFPPRNLIGRHPGEVRHLIDELVVDQRPASAQALDDQARDLRPARRVLPRDRDERLYRYGCRRLRRRSPMFSIGIPPDVGTRITRLLDDFSSRRTSKYCRVSASGVSVVFSSRCCSACSRATSTRCRSVSTCCSCAILLLIAWTTCAGGCRSRRKNAVTVAMRNFPTPPRGWVTRAESVSASMVRAIWVRLEMSLIEYCTIPSRTPLRMAFSTAPRIWSSLPISV